MRIMTATLLLLPLFATPQLALAHGDVTCNEARTEWRPSVELQAELKKAGWTVRKIQIENGCYEVYGFDENAKRVEAFFNPKTFERVL